MSRFSLSGKQLLELLIQETVNVMVEAEPAKDFQDSTRPIKRSVSGGAPSKNPPPSKQVFSFENLDKIEDPNEKVKYAYETLKYIDQGSSRFVFKLDEKHVLKLVHPMNVEAGKQQNEAETEVCEANRGLFVNVYKHSPDFTWIVADFALPMDEGTFGRLTKIDWNIFVSALHIAFRHAVNKITPQNEQDYELVKDMPFFQLVVSVANECQLVPGDLTNIKNWANFKGYPKLIDFGFKNRHIGKIRTK